MVHLRRFAWLLLCSVVVAGAPSSPAGAALPPANVAGSYALEVVEENVGCRWIGTVVLRQNGSDFEGTASIQLVAGSTPPCIESLTGDVSGQVSGQQITFGAAFSGVGMATFKGEVSADGQLLTGVWSSGPLEGTWLARRIVSNAAPALGTLALIMLIAVLGWTGMSSVRRRGRRGAV